MSELVECLMNPIVGTTINGSSLRLLLEILRYVQVRESASLGSLSISLS